MSNTWHWTNEAHTEARKGNWRVERFLDVGWSIRHDDFPGFSKITGGEVDKNWHRFADGVPSDFLTWQAAQRPVPLAIPEVGRWVRATFADGHVDEFEVTENERRVGYYNGVTWVARRDILDHFYIDHRPEQTDGQPHIHIVSWSYIDPPQPAEPTGLGAVVEVGPDRYVLAYRAERDDYPWRDDAGNAYDWRQVSTLGGPVTILSDGVTP